MTSAVLDINTERIWAAAATDGQAPQLIHLDGEHAELPMTLSLAGRRLEMGRSVMSAGPDLPQSLCSHFLPHLGDERTWHYRRHRIDAASALAHTFCKVRTDLPSSALGILALPGYLSHEQMVLAGRLARESGLKVGAVLSRILAVGLRSYAQHPWHNVGVFVDIDDHAMTVAVLRPADAELRILSQQVRVELSLRRWKEGLLASIADQCIRRIRRDPRESAEAENTILKQIDRVLDGGSQNQPTTVHVQGLDWRQAITVSGAQAASACESLCRCSAREIQFALQWADQLMTSATIYLTASAARLPGLAAAIYALSENKTPLIVLSADASAHAGHELALRILRGQVAPGIFGHAVPLPSAATKVVSRVLRSAASNPQSAISTFAKKSLIADR